MTNCKRVLALGSGLLLGMAGVVHADTTTPSDADLKAEVAALRARVTELEGAKSNDGLNEARAEQVKSLVRDVLADADTRASLLEGGPTAGYSRDKGFYISSESNDFLLKLHGQINIRYVLNMRENSSAQNQDVRDPDTGEVLVSNNNQPKSVGGFEIPFVKLTFDGHIASPRIMYSVTISAERNTEYVRTEEVLLSYKLADNWTLWAGETKAPFMREELVDDAHQLAVDRSVVNTIFSVGRVQGLGVKWDANDSIRVNASFNDGAHSGEPGGQGTESGLFGGTQDKSFDGSNSLFAFTARTDIKVWGDWSQLEDFNSWSGSPQALFFGAAAHYESASVGRDQAGGSRGFIPYDSVFLWTIDGTYKNNGLGVYAAVVGAHSNGVSGPPAGNTTNCSDSIAFLAQASYFVTDKLEPFIRFEWINLDDAGLGAGPGAQDIKIATFGANYYLAKHAAKFTLDLVWCIDTLNTVNTGGTGLSGLGLVQNDIFGNQNQVSIRAQFQLLF